MANSMKYLPVVVFVSLLTVACTSQTQEEPRHECSFVWQPLSNDPDNWRSPVSVDPAIRSEVEALIDSMTLLGMEGAPLDTVWGSGFPPAEGAYDYYAEFWGPGHRDAGTPDSFRRIVEIGADAVPVLCEHLQDSRPTGLVFDGYMPAGGAWFAQEYDWNDGWQQSPGDEFHYFGSPAIKFLEASDSKLFPHDFRIADLCYKLIGCIVNRRFFAARPQPSMCAVLNSPIYAPELARLTREDWGAITPQKLRESLVNDFLTPDLAGNERRGRRSGAYIRLAFYSPDDAVKLAKDFLLKPRVDGGPLYSVLDALKAAKDLNEKWGACRSKLSADETEVLIKYLRHDAHSVPGFPGDGAALRVLRALFPDEDPTREREYSAATNYEVRDLLRDLVFDEDPVLDSIVANVLKEAATQFPKDAYNQDMLAWGCVERLHRRARNDEAVMAYIKTREPSNDSTSEQLWDYYKSLIENRTK